MSVKCPNCGSSAQVKRELAVPSESANGDSIFIHYNCGCGCHFMEKFQHACTMIKWVEDIRKK